ncbi:MAG: ABC transporter ATP-binding protein [Ruminococcus sp.]|nr:ABC transporter ATP-binding protein [Ruminococcus sp.]
MNNDIVIDVKNITKKFRIYFDKGSQLKEKLLFRKRTRYEEREVLKGISFQVRRGEAIGLIGHNGCGKSTTLKLLTKIMYADSGEIVMKGRVSSLIELGAGFHPDMSGRENIYTNASIFGLTKKEVDARFNKIVEFSELKDFIDNPVRTYSSGMYMRLAFSVAINVDADILLIDEILAVGDTNFQTKCFNRLRELKSHGMTIIIVTHDLSTIEKFCDRAIWLNDGIIVREGRSDEVVDAYFSFMNDKKIEHEIKTEKETENIPEQASEPKPPEEIIEIPKETPENNNGIDYSANRFGLKYVEIKKAEMLNHENKDVRIFRTGENLKIKIHYHINKKLDEYVFGFGFYTLEGKCLYGNNTQLDRIKLNPTNSDGIISVEIENLPLLAGQYILNVAVVDADGTPMDFYRNYCEFEVISDDRSTGYFSISHEWRL